VSVCKEDTKKKKWRRQKKRRRRRIQLRKLGELAELVRELAAEETVILDRPIYSENENC